jgi:hypothetical protein
MAREFVFPRSAFAIAPISLFHRSTTLFSVPFPHEASMPFLSVAHGAPPRNGVKPMTKSSPRRRIVSVFDGNRDRRFALLRRPYGASRAELSQIGNEPVDAWRLRRMAEAVDCTLVVTKTKDGVTRYRFAA